MRYLRTQGGFTLVELVLVLAISSLLLTGVLAGSSNIQNETAFTSAIDSVRLQLKAVQNEASQSVTSGAGNTAYTTFGKLVEFNNATPATASQMKTWTLVEGGTAPNQSLYKCDESDPTLSQAVNFMSATNSGVAGSVNTEAIIFARGDPGQTYLDPNFTDPQTGNSAICSSSASAAPAAPGTPTLCAGFTRTQSDPAGNCPLPPAPPRPPEDCSADPAWQCGLFGQYYTGALTNPSRILNSAFIDEGIGQAASAVQSYPSFLPVLPNRTKNPPTNVSVSWSGQILIGADDSPALTTHTYCFRDSYIGYLTIDNIPATGPVTNSCVTLTPSQLSLGAGWYPITVSFQTGTGVGASAQLYEQDAFTSNAIVEVPGGDGGDLRTSSSNQTVEPASAFANGLYGQYYSDVNLSNRVSAYTDPLIGDGGSKFSFSTADGFTDTDTSVFLPTLRWNTASSDASGKSVKWTGQILVDTAGSQTYCTDSDDGAQLLIDGTTIEKGGYDPAGGIGHATTRFCGNVTLTAGWHNLEVDYVNLCCSNTSNGAYATARLVQLNSAGAYVEVPHDHLRRPLDWTAVGDTGTCNPADSAFCVHNNNSTGTWAASSSSDGSCGQSNHIGQITYTKTGLMPDSTYNMDISYFNEPDGSYTVPSSYSYQVCVGVNGTTLNSGNPVSLPISEPSLNPRTYTMSGITVPASGKITVTLDWLNDAWQSVCGVPFLACYDANFGVSRLDLYRNLNANGTLSAAASKAGPSSTAVAAATKRRVASTVASASGKSASGKNVTSKNGTGASLTARLLGLVAPSADAASACDTNVLNIANYTAGCFASVPSTSLKLQVPGYHQIGTITVSTTDGSIERSITN